MKIALVSPYTMQQLGGVPEHVSHLHDELERLGHDVAIMAPRGNRGGLEISNGNFGIGRTITIPGNGSRMKLTFDVTLYADVKAIMAREKFDIVHLHEPLMPVLPYMVLLNSSAVNVGTFHAFSRTNHWYTAFKPYMQFVLTRMDSRIAVSEPAKTFVQQYFDGSYKVIPNGIDTDMYGGTVEPFPWASDGIPRILFVGRFEEPRKGFKYLVRALALVQQQFPETRLVVCGYGRPERFDQLIERYGARNIEFKGVVSHEDKVRYYASCDVACVPSTGNESFGYTVVEPMASAKPVVATNIPGYASVVTSGVNGLLVEPKNAQALALGLVRALSDRELRQRLGLQGQIDAQQYAWPRVAERVLREYQEASQRAKLAPWRQELAT